MARPSKITPAVRQAVAEGLAHGNTLRDVAAGARISERTLNTWLARANRAEHAHRSTGRVPAAEKPYLDLHEAIVEAEADADLHSLQQIMQFVAVGVDLATAAQAAGVPMRTLERLQNHATQCANRREDGDRLSLEDVEYLKLYDGFAQATAAMKVKALGALNRDMLSDWRAAAWWLERMHPDEFASPNRRREGAQGGRPRGATSAPDRPSTADEPPPRLRLRQVGS
jgi:hypothetical protein